MSEPLVCAVMLTKDRPEMTRRAVECFREQTYPRRSLLVYDTSTVIPSEYPDFGSSAILYHYRGPSGSSIGALRNEASEFAMIAKQPKEIDILIHFDSDDWSHPNRITEQVAFLQHSGADAVGYREMLFWREEQQLNSPTNLRLVVAGKVIQPLSDISYAPEAWLYSNPHPRYCLGTSLCYWRSAWERNPFPDTSRGEEGQPMVGWQSKLKCASVSVMMPRAVIGIAGKGRLIVDTTMHEHGHEPVPRMIASLHGGNTCSAIDPNSPFWKRAPEFDEYCRERMTL